MRSQLKLEGSIFSANRRWSAHLGLDANSTIDPVGDEFQWATLAASYNSDSRWFHGVRFGLRKNLAGAEIAYGSLGITAFKFFNLDISSAFDSVKIDGQTLPQGLMASIGFEIGW